MLNRSYARAAAGAALVTLAIPAMAQSGRLALHRNDVVPVVLEDHLSTSESRRGDRFSASVTSDSRLPRGTELHGRVIDVQRKRNDRPAYLELEFTEIEFPDGKRSRIRAVPIAWNDRNVRRSGDGRFTASKDVVRKERIVGAGALAGLVIGALGDRGFQGLVLGTIAGILIAEGQAQESGREARLTPGTKLGALIESPVTLTWDRRTDRWDDWGRDDRNGDDWDRPYRRDDDWDDRRSQEWNYDSERRIRIEYRGEELRYSGDEQPYRLGNTVMVPLERTARQLDLEVTELRGSEVLLVEDEDSVLKIEQGSREYRLNGRRGTLSRNIVRRDGVVYVPIEVLAEMKQDPVRANGMTRLDRTRA